MVNIQNDLMLNLLQDQTGTSGSGGGAQGCEGSPTQEQNLQKRATTTASEVDTIIIDVVHL